MTTLIILTLLVAAWTGYFIYCVKDSSVVMQMRNSTEAFSRNLGAISESATGAVQLSAGASPMGSGRALLDLPRSSHAASRRRRNITIGLAVFALASLISTEVGLGVIGWAVFILSLIALLSFVGAAAHWKRQSAEQEIRLMMLNHSQSLGHRGDGAVLSALASTRPMATQPSTAALR